MKGAQNQNYFTLDTTRYIEEYNAESNEIKRNRIFNDHLRKPLLNIINNSILKYGGIQYMDGIQEDDVVNEIMSFIILKVFPKHNPSIKDNFFSYICTAVRNYIYINNKAGYKRIVERIEDNPVVIDMDRNVQAEEQNEEYDRYKMDLFDVLRSYWSGNIDTVFIREKDRNIAKEIMALLDEFRNIEEIDKRVLFYIIRERTGYKTFAITKVLNVMKSHIKCIKDDLSNRGTIRSIYYV